MDKSPRRNPDNSAHTNPTQPHLIEWNDPTSAKAISNILREQDKTVRWRTRPHATCPKAGAIPATVYCLFAIRDLSKAEVCRALAGRIPIGEVLETIDSLIVAGELEVAK